MTQRLRNATSHPVVSSLGVFSFFMQRGLLNVIDWHNGSPFSNGPLFSLLFQDALDQWRHYILRKTGTFPVKAGLDELSTSAISDEESDADGQYWDKLLTRGQVDENLVRVIKQRLHELEELGATDAYNLLLSYLQNSGWELDDLQPVGAIHESEEMKAVNRSGTSVFTSDSSESDGQQHPSKPVCSSHLTDTEDSGKYSISHGEPSPESGSAEQTSNEESKSPTRDEITEITLRTASPSFRIEQIHSQVSFHASKSKLRSHLVRKRLAVANDRKLSLFYF